MTSNTPDRILVRVDYDGTHDGQWLAVAPHEPPHPYTGMEPQYLLSTPVRESAEELLEALEAIARPTKRTDQEYFQMIAIAAIAEARGEG